MSSNPIQESLLRNQVAFSWSRDFRLHEAIIFITVFLIGPPLAAIHSQTNPVHTLIYYIKINFNIILPSTIGIIASGFPTKILYAFLMACPSHHFITLIQCG
jgi:hypothetical protein